MADRLADRLAIAKVAAAALAALGRMLDRHVGVGDHLTMRTLMARLATGLTARRLTLGALGRLRQIA